MDASSIEAPSSTKNRAGVRDPQMHQVKKGNQYHFGMKVHIGVDVKTGLVHNMTTSSANVHYVTEAHRLLNGGESQVWGDAGYLGVQKREENRKLAVGVAGGDEAWAAAQTGAAQRDSPGGKGQGVYPGQGGTPFPGSETVVWLLESALPGSGQEHRPTGFAAGIGQLADIPAYPGRLTQGAMGPKPGLDPKKSPGRGGKDPTRDQS